MQGLAFSVLKRMGKCQNCSQPITKGTKSVVLGSYSNEYRYCIPCFISNIEVELDVKILDFVEDKMWLGE